MTDDETAGPDECLRPLVGRWVGEGEGCWISDPPFRYGEEVTFLTTGKGFLTYQQRTWSAGGGRALHTETGYLRATGAGGVEALFVQPTGFTEIHVGSFEAQRLDLELIALARSPTALNVTGIARNLVVGTDTFSYSLRMAMNDEPLADHLRGRLRRQAGI